MDKRASIALSAAIMLASAYGVLSALDWPLKAKLFPLVVGIPLFFLATAELVFALRGIGNPVTAPVDTADEVPADLARRRTLIAIGWIFGFFAAIVLLGFPVAVPAFVLFYLRLLGRETWLYSAIFAAVVGALFYGLFDVLLHLPFPAGWLLEVFL